jgi:CheY-like chemotaxis protein
MHTILLAEDDEDNRDLVSFILKRSQLDIDLVIAENGQQAVSLALEKNPHLILMDMQMPVMDGWTAVKALKSNDQTSRIPVIAFTAQVKAEDIARTRELGCAEHCAKPIDPAQFVDMIKKYIQP